MGPDTECSCGLRSCQSCRQKPMCAMSLAGYSLQYALGPQPHASHSGTRHRGKGRGDSMVVPMASSTHTSTHSLVSRKRWADLQSDDSDEDAAMLPKQVFCGSSALVRRHSSDRTTSASISGVQSSECLEGSGFASSTPRAEETLPTPFGEQQHCMDFKSGLLPQARPCVTLACLDLVSQQLDQLQVSLVECVGNSSVNVQLIVWA
jgi:hypothetical protein